MKKLTLTLVGIAALGLGACSSKQRAEMADNQPSMAAKQIAVEEEASYVTEFTFAKGSARLTDDAKSNLRGIIDSARKNGKVDEIKVITWGDTEYPSVHTDKLSKTEVDLVKKRNQSIEKFVESYNKDLDVDLYSMAERPGAIQRLFGTSDARIKRSLETAGVPNTDSSVKMPSKASKSIVMVIVE